MVKGAEKISYQQSFTDMEYNNRKRKTKIKREEFLEAMKGNLKIKKTSSDGKVEGFTFRVTGVNGYDSTFTTDKNGEISVEGLRIGEYTVSEVSDNVSAGYILPADKKVTVKVGETVEIEMHNELRDTPKTGDDRKTSLWVALAGASALGIVATVVASKRKKKKEGNE